MSLGIQLRNWSQRPRSSLPAARILGKMDADVAAAIGVLLTPAAFLAMVFAVWRLGSDLSWTERFPIASGPFSHWLVWVGVAALLETCAVALGRSRRLH
jgi:hypothetical protein